MPSKRSELYMRVSVVRWDDEYIYAHPSTDASDEMVIAYARLSDGSDGSYLASLLSEGCQVNLIEPTESEGVWHARLLIYEPDYLVDVTSIASCCESYSHSHLLHLLGKLRPSASTEAILLGHFAGQLLDEEVHGLYGASYRDSVLAFFKQHLLQLLMADVSGDFHNQARMQKEHIHHAINDMLPRMAPVYNADEVILEPSFISEMLGIQGRMDLLQMDYSLLIEQKSGRCGWPQRSPDIPVEQAKHYMQLMLYRAVVIYNFHEHYLSNGGQVHSFLLYSKYPQSLLPLGTSEELLSEAMKIRNHIVWAEHYYAQGGIDSLFDMEAEDFNEYGLSTPLWTRYQKPQLEDLLRPIKDADTMERAYYHRFATFVAREHMYAKVGSAATGEHGYASKWRDTLEAKYDKGDIYDHLRLLSPSEEHEGRVECLQLALADGYDMQACNFRVGDIVVLYSYESGSVPDARRGILFRCTLSAMSDDTLTLMLRAPQSDARVFLRDAHKEWAVEHDFMEASFASQYRALHAFLSMPRERRDLVLLRRHPSVDVSRHLVGSYGEFDEVVLRAKRARELFLIIGPPGTGKTSYGLMSVLREELASDAAASVLLLAYTNRAVDEICSKLVGAGLDFIRLGNSYSCPSEYHPYLLDAVVGDTLSLAHLRGRIGDARIVVATTTAINAHIGLLGLKSFSLAIVDEASQILEPHLLGVFAARHGSSSSVGRVVLIGDHKQLPAVVKQPVAESQVDDPLLHEALLTDCRQSLFERLLKRYRHDADVTYMLCRQGRMHRDIARFPSDTFYHGQLTEVTSEQHAALPPIASDAGAYGPLFSCRVAFVNSPCPASATASKVNASEAALIAAIAHHTARRYGEEFSPATTLGVIVPYRNQISAVRHALATYGIPQLADITIDTVERYQGSQREVIIYGFTVQHPSQMDFLTESTFMDEDTLVDRKLNVVMTRARQHLFLVGHASLLATNPIFANLVQFVRDGGGYFDIGPLSFPEKG